MTGSRDTDDRSNDCWKFSHLKKKNNILKYIKIENSYNISQY